VTDPEVAEAADRLTGRHPIRYQLSGDDSVWKRCPTCEQWSPCDVRVLMDAAVPARGYLADETIVNWIP
jgi:hypothetical protein